MSSQYVGASTHTTRALQTTASDGLVSSSLSGVFLRLGHRYFTLKNDKYHFSGTPTKPDWDAWKAYTSTITELNVAIPESHGGRNTISSRAWVRLAQLLHTNPLFSNLKRLKIDNPRNLPVIYLQFMIPPSLESVEINGLEEDDIQTLLAFFTDHVLQLPLKRLILHDMDLPPEIFAALPSCQNLQTLDIKPNGSLIDVDWIKFSLFTKLQTLKLHASRHQFPGPSLARQNNPTPVLVLPTPSLLKDLELVGSTHMLFAILDAACMQSASFQSLKIAIDDKIDHNLFTALFALLQTKQVGSLLELSISFSIDQFVPPVLQTNLASFPKLRKLELPFHVIESPDTNIPKNVLPTKAWSNLQHLNIANDLFQTDPGKLGTQEILKHSVSLQGLKTIAEICPHLQHLQVLVKPPLDGKPYDPSGGFLPYILFHGLQTLVIGSRGPLPDPYGRSYEESDVRLNPEGLHSFARYIYAMFPEAEIQPQQRWDMALWKAVSELISLCRAIAGDIGEVGRRRRTLQNLDGRGDTMI